MAEGDSAMMPSARERAAPPRRRLSASRASDPSSLRPGAPVGAAEAGAPDPPRLMPRRPPGTLAPRPLRKSAPDACATPGEVRASTE